MSRLIIADLFDKTRIRAACAQWWPVGLFFGLLVTYLVYGSWSIALESGVTDQASQATAFGIDISARVTRFVVSVLVFYAVFVVTLLSFASMQKLSSFRSLFFNTGLIGLMVFCGMALHPVSFAVPSSLWVIAGLCITEVALVYLFPFESIGMIEQRIWLWVSSTLGLWSVVVYFLMLEGVSFLVATLFGVLVTAAWCWLLLFIDTCAQRVALPAFLALIVRIVFFLQATAILFTLLPIWVNESIVLFRVRLDAVVQPVSIVAAFFALYAFLVVAYLIVTRHLSPRSLREMITKDVRLLYYWVYPMCIVVASVFSWYELTTHESLELFEQANPGLLIQQWFDFGKIPFVDTFNAHGFSDAVWGFFYTALFGFSAEQWNAYDFLQRVVELVFFYYFLGSLTKRYQFAAVFVLFYSSLDVVIPFYFTPALVLSLLIARYHRHKTTTGFLWLFVVSLVLFWWKIDIGSSAVLAVLATVCFIQMSDVSALFFRKKELVVIACGAAMAGAIGVFFLSQHGSIFVDRCMLVLHIFNSNQTFGYPKLSGSVNTIAVLDYALMPLGLTAMLVWIFLHYKTWAVQLRDRRMLDVIVYSAFFSLALHTRGLVRHTLLLGYSYVVLSFSILAFGLFAFFLVEKKDVIKNISKNLSLQNVFVFVIFILTLTMSMRTEYLMHLYERLETSGSVVDYGVSHWFTMAQQSFPKRVVTLEPEKREAAFGNTKRFLDAQLTPDQTFFDFSTNPMLYVYTHRKSPHYANHTMMYHDVFLQNELVRELHGQDIPVLIFSVSEPGVYNLDTIPFQYRYPIVSEYIYGAYRPFAVIDGREVWVRKDWSVPHPEKMDDIVFQPIDDSRINSTMNLGLLPLLLRHDTVAPVRSRFMMYQAAPNADLLTTPSQFVGMQLPVAQQIESTSMLVVRGIARGGSRVPVQVSFSSKDQKKGSGVFHFDMLGDGVERQYWIRVSTAYQWWNNTSQLRDVFFQLDPNPVSGFEVVPKNDQSSTTESASVDIRSIELIHY